MQLCMVLLYILTAGVELIVTETAEYQHGERCSIRREDYRGNLERWTLSLLQWRLGPTQSAFKAEVEAEVEAEADVEMILVLG